MAMGEGLEGASRAMGWGSCPWGTLAVDILVLSCGVGVDREAPGLSSRTSEQVKWLTLKRGMSLGP